MIQREEIIGDCRLLLAISCGGDERALRASSLANFPGDYPSCSRSHGGRSRLGSAPAAGAVPLERDARAGAVWHHVLSRLASRSRSRRGISRLGKGGVRARFSTLPPVASNRNFEQGRASASGIASLVHRRSRKRSAIDGLGACQLRDLHSPARPAVRSVAREDQGWTGFGCSLRCM